MEGRERRRGRWARMPRARTHAHAHSTLRVRELQRRSGLGEIEGGTHGRGRKAGVSHSTSSNSVGRWDEGGACRTPRFLAGSPETPGTGGGARGVHARVARHPESVSAALGWQRGVSVGRSSSPSPGGGMNSRAWWPSLVLLQCLLFELYLILLPVFIRIHWGMGRFCFCFLARNLLILKVLWEDMVRQRQTHAPRWRRKSDFLSLASFVPVL
uniref:Uncharacterized protein n=1 Tax=Myotis myotis TaxID=51298 RepID=A0A7J7ZXT3_MYOMY|nr:hypothetical protein mMyoMyo1_009804 [Myotis myotis]